MAGRPTIIVVGEESLLAELRGRFPPSVCESVRCDTSTQALNRASPTSVLVVDMLSHAAEFADELVSEYRRLAPRAKVVVRVPLGARHPRADHVVAPEDVPGLGDAVMACFPRPGEAAADTRVGTKVRASVDTKLDTKGRASVDTKVDTKVRASVDTRADTSVDAQPPEEFFEGADEDFDFEASARAFRKEETLTGQWPPPPPTLQRDTDELDFARTYAGYVSSLIEAHEDPSALSQAERDRLGRYSGQVVDSMDSVLDTTQKAVNAALMRKDLGRMRELSSARTAMYEKLQSLRARQPEVATRQKSDKRSRETPLATAAMSNELAAATRAAAAQVGEDEQAAKTKAGRKRRPSMPWRRPTLHTARKERRFGLPPWAMGVGVMLVLVGVGMLVRMLMKPSYSVAERDGANKAPTMKHVQLRQAPDGIVVAPAAVDPEGDPLSFTLRWQRNGMAIPNVVGPRLGNDRFEPGDRIEVVAIPNDPYGAGQPMKSIALKAGAPPARPAPPPETRLTKQGQMPRPAATPPTQGVAKLPSWK